MTREETKYCEECKHCKQITCLPNQDCIVTCNKGTKYDKIIYCKYKKLKKEKKENVK